MAVAEVLTKPAGSSISGWGAVAPHPFIFPPLCYTEISSFLSIASLNGLFMKTVKLIFKTIVVLAGLLVVVLIFVIIRLSDVWAGFSRTTISPFVQEIGQNGGAGAPDFYFTGLERDVDNAVGPRDYDAKSVVFPTQYPLLRYFNGKESLVDRNRVAMVGGGKESASSSVILNPTLILFTKDGTFAKSTPFPNSQVYEILEYQWVQDDIFLHYQEAPTHRHYYYLFDPESNTFNTLSAGETLRKRETSSGYDLFGGDEIYPHPTKKLFAASYCLRFDLGGCTRRSVVLGNSEKIEEIFYTPSSPLMWTWNSDALLISVPDRNEAYVADTTQF